MHQLIHYKKINGEVYPQSECAINISTLKNESCEVDTEVFWRADGTCFDVQYASNPISQQNEQKGAVITFSDITQRKKAGERLAESERNLNAILFSTQEAIYLLDTGFRLVLMNKASQVVMKQMTNQECKLGENFLSYFDETKKTALLDLYTKVLQGEHVEAERKTVENGNEYYYSATYFPVKDESGEIINICCTSKNITEKRKTEEAIKAANIEKEEYQYRFQAILDNSPQAVLTRNLNGELTFINKTFLENYGSERLGSIGKKTMEVFNDTDDIVQFDEIYDEVIAERKIKEWEQKMTLKNGREREVQVTKFPLYDREKSYLVRALSAKI